MKARTNWELLHQDDEVEQEMMLPLIRLKVRNLACLHGILIL